jgi:G3E family GTPase
VISFSQAGPSIQIGVHGFWIASLPEEEQTKWLEEYPELRERWDPTHGDRMTELVLIGMDMDRERIVRALDNTTLTDEEMGMDWKTFTDPLPKVETVEVQEVEG